MTTLAVGHTLSLTLWIVGIAVVVSIVAGIVGRFLVKRGLRTPLLVRLINRVSERIVDTIKRPITVAVLDEVAEVLSAGHYTRNAAAALRENSAQLEQMITEKIKADPTAGRIGLVPFHDRLLADLTQTTMRIVLAVLADPRTDELVADLLRDNITQLRAAVRDMPA